MPGASSGEVPGMRVVHAGLACRMRKNPRRLLAAYVRVGLMLSFMGFLAAAASPIPGDSACTACHITQATHYRTTPMADALEKVDVCIILQQHPNLAFQ